MLSECFSSSYHSNTSVFVSLPLLVFLILSISCFLWTHHHQPVKAEAGSAQGFSSPLSNCACFFGNVRSEFSIQQLYMLCHETAFDVNRCYINKSELNVIAVECSSLRVLAILRESFKIFQTFPYKVLH